MHSQYSRPAGRASRTTRRGLLTPAQVQRLHALGYTGSECLTPDVAAALRAAIVRPALRGSSGEGRP